MGHSRVCRLSCPEGAKAGVVIDFIESTDLLGTIHISTAVRLRREVGMIKDVEILHPELQPVTLGNVDVLGSRHIHIPRIWQTQEVFTHIADSARSISARCWSELGVDLAGRQKCTRIEPALAGYGHIGTAGRTVGGNAR